MHQRGLVQSHSAHCLRCPPHSWLVTLQTAHSRRVGNKLRQAGRLLSTRSVAVMEATAPSKAVLELETNSHGLERIALKKNGWDSWTWQGHRVNFCQSGSRGTPIVLVHGFGASVYHWRHNIPALAKSHRVFALDMLGFGWSDKPVLEYSGCHIWADQVAAFITEVVKEPAVVVGNSLGGYTCLLVAALTPQHVRGVVLVNSAGRFSEPQAAVETALQDDSSAPFREAVQQEAHSEASAQQATTSGTSAVAMDGDSEDQPGLLSRLMAPLRTMAMRASVYVAFIATKQPVRIRQVLKQVYWTDDNVDDDLVQSIALPAKDPNAADVFYRVITGWGKPIPDVLSRVKVLLKVGREAVQHVGYNKISLPEAPLFLLWGEKDPWITPEKAQGIKRLYSNSEYFGLDAGHCPQDDTPEPFNAALLDWVDRKA